MNQALGSTHMQTFILYRGLLMSVAKHKIAASMVMGSIPFLALIICVGGGVCFTVGKCLNTSLIH